MPPMKPKLVPSKAAEANQKSKEKAKRQTELLRQPPQTCNSCQQTTHDYDVDLLPVKVHLRWCKLDISQRTGAASASGHECSVCFSTRRRFFGDPEKKGYDSQQEVIQARQKNSDVDSRWRRLRKDRATGAK